MGRFTAMTESEVQISFLNENSLFFLPKGLTLLEQFFWILRLLLLVKLYRKTVSKWDQRLEGHLSSPNFGFCGVFSHTRKSSWHDFNILFFLPLRIATKYRLKSSYSNRVYVFFKNCSLKESYKKDSCIINLSKNVSKNSCLFKFSGHCELSSRTWFQKLL